VEAAPVSGGSQSADRPTKSAGDLAASNRANEALAYTTCPEASTAAVASGESSNSSEKVKRFDSARAFGEVVDSSMTLLKRGLRNRRAWKDVRCHLA
jgi:hypothetical protein